MKRLAFAVAVALVCGSAIAQTPAFSPPVPGTMTFATAPNRADTPDTLVKREAVSLWNIEHSGISIGSALPAGTAVIGKVGVDQTTDGTTNKVINSTSVAGADGLANVIAKVFTPGGSATTAPSAAFNYFFNGTTWDRARVSNKQKDWVALDISGATDVFTPSSGKKIRLMGGSISISVAGAILFKFNGNSSLVYQTPKLAADTPYTFVVLGGQGILSPTADWTVAAIAVSGSGTITGTLYGTEE